MPNTPKLREPDQLPAHGVTEVQLKKWEDQLRTYLLQFDDYNLFLDSDGIYREWRAAEDYPNRLALHYAPDQAADLTKRRNQLRTLLSIVAKCCSDADYSPVLQHSTSFEWIVQKIREDNDIQRKGIHFLNIIDLKYDPTSQTPTAFYNIYRAHFIDNLRKNGDVVSWKSATPIGEDEKISYLLEDTILLMVINLIDHRLLAHIREVYSHQMGVNKCLRDFKTDILVGIPKMLNDINTKEASVNMVQSAAIKHEPYSNDDQNYEDYNTDGTYDPSVELAAFQLSSRGNSRGFFRGNQRRPNQSRGFQSRGYSRPSQPRGRSNTSFNRQGNGFCRVCQLAGMSPSIVHSHRIGDARCTSLSTRDKDDLRDYKNAQINHVGIDEFDEQAAYEYGYSINTGEVDHNFDDQQQ